MEACCADRPLLVPGALFLSFFFFFFHLTVTDINVIKGCGNYRRDWQQVKGEQKGVGVGAT